MAEYEICEIKRVVTGKTNEILFLRDESTRFYILVKNVSSNEVITTTDEYEIKALSITPGAEEEFSRILDNLYTEGWEVAQIPGEVVPDAWGIGIGAWIKLKREIKSLSNDLPDDELVQAAWKLKQAGIVDAEMFETILQNLQNRK